MGKSSAAPAWLSKGAPQLQPGRLSQGLVAHAWQGTGDFSGSQPAWPPQEACLSLSQPSCHKCATLQLLESALLDQSFVASAQLQLLPFQRDCREMVGERSSLKGRCSPFFPTFLSRVPKLQALKEGRLSCLNFTESQNHLSWKGPLRSSNPTSD